jgi:hypothetical protein
MFRPDPNGRLTVEDALAELTALLNELPPDSPQAKQLAGTIHRLQNLTERSDPLPS